MVIPPSQVLHDFVCFRGQDIMDLHVHDAETEEVGPWVPCVLSPWTRRGLVAQRSLGLWVWPGFVAKRSITLKPLRLGLCCLAQLMLLSEKGKEN